MAQTCGAVAIVFDNSPQIKMMYFNIMTIQLIKQELDTCCGAGDSEGVSRRPESSLQPVSCVTSRQKALQTRSANRQVSALCSYSFHIFCTGLNSSNSHTFNKLEPLRK